MRGPDVLELQQRLNQSLLYNVEEDGTYDAEVTRAVTEYQLLNGIEGDPRGVYGRNTRRHLESHTTEP
ncbi:peptidoglycan-binding domain-containing protein [Streptomyces sp. KR80]|uniref:peptidoglycan-binding domain-containing protein n=1 Tax=Streptomyces sp. KR80 TaxID=3457426 RepID=UPI003FCFED07